MKKTELIITETEEDTIVTAVKLCSGYNQHEFEGFDGKEIPLLRELQGAIGEVIFQTSYYSLSEKVIPIKVGNLILNKRTKACLKKCLEIYAGYFPDRYKGADLYKKETAFLIEKLKQM